MACDPNRPSYDLREIQDLVLGGQYTTSGTAQLGLGELGFDETDLERCIHALTAADFHKTMVAESMPASSGLMQDVYKRLYCGQHVYVKLQVLKQKGGRHAVVISFKRK